MAHQGYNSRLNESLGARNGKTGQSLKSRRNESEGMSNSMGKRKYSADKSMPYHHNNLKVHKHQMSKFKRLVSKLMADGKSETAAKKIAYTIGANKYGKRGMAAKAAAGRRNA